MELNVNDTFVENPTAADIERALAAKSFPEDWYITLDSETGAYLDALAQPDGTFALTHVDNDRRRSASPNVGAAQLGSIYKWFLAGDRSWDSECRWIAERTPPRSLIGKLTTPSTPDGSGPPPWAVAVMAGVIGLVVLTFMLVQWTGTSIVPFGNSTTFIVGLIFTPLVALVLVAVAAKMIETRQAASWLQAGGKIVRSEVETRRHRIGDGPETVTNVPAVEYEFAALGQNWRGRRIAIGEDTGGANTEATLARYPAGREVTVFYDPADPANCVLERDVPAGVAKGCGVLLVFAALVVGAIYLLATRGPDLIAARFPNANASVVIFAASFGLVVLLFFFAARRYSQQAAHWPSVPGRIVGSGVESYQEMRDNRTTTYWRPAVEFAYEVRGHAYRSRQIKLNLEASGSKGAAEKVAARYPAGSAVEVHYEPANASNAALENPTGATWILAAVALFCFGVAIYALWQ